MADIDIKTCENEEELVALLGKTEDFDKRKQIRDRLKEIRAKADQIREEKRKARAAMGNVDSIQTKLAQAEQEKARKLKAMETTTRTMMETTDIVKAQMERAEELKEDQMKQFEQMAKEGGSAVYQGGFDAAARLDQEYAQKEKERKLQAFSDQQHKEHQNVKKEELIPKTQNVIVDAAALKNKH